MNESDFCTFRVGESVKVVNPDGRNRFPIGAELVVYQIADKFNPGRGHLYFVATRHNVELATAAKRVHPENYDSFFADQLRKV